MFPLTPRFNSWNIPFLKSNTCDFVFVLRIAVLNIAKKNRGRQFLQKNENTQNLPQNALSANFSYEMIKYHC